MKADKYTKEEFEEKTALPLDSRNIGTFNGNINPGDLVRTTPELEMLIKLFRGELK